VYFQFSAHSLTSFIIYTHGRWINHIALSTPVPPTTATACSNNRTKLYIRGRVLIYEVCLVAGTIRGRHRRVPTLTARPTTDGWPGRFPEGSRAPSDGVICPPPLSRRWR